MLAVLEKLATRFSSRSAEPQTPAFSHAKEPTYMSQYGPYTKPQERCFVDVAIDSKRGQSVSTLEAAFAKAGFDKNRDAFPCKSEDPFLAEYYTVASYYPPSERGGDDAVIYAYPHEVKSLEDQGYQTRMPRALPFRGFYI